MSAPRRTKIVATVGPASREPAVLRELIEAGVDVFRLNFSHGTAAEHAENVSRIREVSSELGVEIGVLGDLPGPKLRLGDLEDDVAVLHSGSTAVLYGQADGGPPGNAERLPVQWEGVANAVSAGDPIYLADGRVRLRVTGVSGGEITAEVEAGGAVSSHQGVNLPGADADLPESGASDAAWVDFACSVGIDLLAVSFVRRPSDLERVRAELQSRGADIPLVAKIEKPQAAERAEEIIEAAESGIMVARGDLGVELPIEEVPAVQKRLISLAGRASKPAITATQMLATMVKASRPTRAEVTDVANAIFDGTDAVMLSEETAVGEHPVEAVRVMDRVARAAERQLPYGEWLYTRVAEARARRRRDRRPGRGRRHLPARPGGDRGPDRIGQDPAPGLGLPPARAGAGGLLQHRHRPPHEPAVRHARRAGRAVGEPAPAAGRLRGARQGRRPGQVGRPDRRHGRAPQPGARHQSVRGPPGALSHPILGRLLTLPQRTG